MEFCDYICSLDNETLKDAFRHLKEEVDELKNF